MLLTMLRLQNPESALAGISGKTWDEKSSKNMVCAWGFERAVIESSNGNLVPLFSSVD